MHRPHTSILTNGHTCSHREEAELRVRQLMTETRADAERLRSQIRSTELQVGLSETQAFFVCVWQGHARLGAE